MNSATETQTPSAKVAAPRHSSGRIIFRYGLALGSVAAATALGFLADRCDLHESVFTIFPFGRCPNELVRRSLAGGHRICGRRTRLQLLFYSTALYSQCHA